VKKILVLTKCGPPKNGVGCFCKRWQLACVKNFNPKTVKGRWNWVIALCTTLLIAGLGGVIYYGSIQEGILTNG